MTGDLDLQVILALSVCAGGFGNIMLIGSVGVVSYCAIIGFSAMEDPSLPRLRRSCLNAGMVAMGDWAAPPLINGGALSHIPDSHAQ